MQEFEFLILNAIQNLRCGFVDALMVFFTTLGEWGAVWIFLGVTLLFFKKYRRLGAIILLGLLVGLVTVNLGIKNIVARPRPCSLNPDIELIIPFPSEYSFPSGHTVSSFSAATSVFLNNRKMGAFALSLAAVIAFSRMYLYVHFPTDILGGIVIGVAISFFATWLFGLCCEKKSNKIDG